MNLGGVTWFNMATFSEAIAGKGAALTNCIGFMDGTVRPCCRPMTGQRAVFNGHKRVHALKFQVDMYKCSMCSKCSIGL